MRVVISGSGETRGDVTARAHRPDRARVRGAGAVERAVRAPVPRDRDVTESGSAQRAAQHGV